MEPKAWIFPTLTFFILCSGQETENIDPVGSTTMPTIQKENKIANAINNFGYKLLVKMMNENKNENIVVSPTGVAGLLAMTLLGSVGTTHNEIAETLGFSQDILKNRKSHEQFGELLQNLNTNVSSKTVYADAMFVDAHAPLRELYRNYLHDVYRGAVFSANFSETEETKNIINEWVNNHTEGHIEQFLKQSLPMTTKVVLLSALYFSGQWEQPFVPEHTTNLEGPFELDKRTPRSERNLCQFGPPSHLWPAATLLQLSPGTGFDSIIQLPTRGRAKVFSAIQTDVILHWMSFKRPTGEVMADLMLNFGSFRYLFSEKHDLHIIALPYNDSATTMYALKPKFPKKMSLLDLMEKIDYDSIDDIINQMNTRKCVIRFPKMEIKSSTKLENTLKAMGVKTMFIPEEANFALMINSNMVVNKTEEEIITRLRDGDDESGERNILDCLPNPGIYVDSILHDVKLTINEFGTEAVAATSGILARSAELFYADSPFYIFIRNERTKLVTFSAAIFDPTN